MAVIRVPEAERLRDIADDYGIESPDYPLSEWNLSRFGAGNLIGWALDNAGVPKRDDNGLDLSFRFRIEYLLNAIKEANDA